MLLHPGFRLISCIYCLFIFRLLFFFNSLQRDSALALLKIILLRLCRSKLVDLDIILRSPLLHHLYTFFEVLNVRHCDVAILGSCNICPRLLNLRYITIVLLDLLTLVELELGHFLLLFLSRCSFFYFYRVFYASHIVVNRLVVNGLVLFGWDLGEIKSRILVEAL